MLKGLLMLLDAHRKIWYGNGWFRRRSTRGLTSEVEARLHRVSVLRFALFNVHTALILRKVVFLTRPFTQRPMLLVTHSPSSPRQTLTHFTKAKRRLLHYRHISPTTMTKTTDSYKARTDAFLS